MRGVRNLGDVATLFRVAVPVMDMLKLLYTKLELTDEHHHSTNP
jgi:hypothetical protein